jgi:hypothetical protein
MNLQRQQYGVMRLLITISVGLFLLSCKKDPTSPPDDRPYIKSQDYGRVILTLTDYDLVRITHQSGLDLKSPDIVRVGVGTKDSAGHYNQFLSFASTYDANAVVYIIHYDYSVKMDSSKTVAPLTVRYFFADSSHSDADTTVSLYKYPYKSAEIFVTPSILIQPGDFQDIARTDSFLYFYKSGFLSGAYEYNLALHQTRLLKGYLSGTYICANSMFVFLYFDGWGIFRYDLNTNTDSLLIREEFPGIITGLDSFIGHLFVHRLIPPYTLRIFSFSGVLVDSINYSLGTTRYMAINDSIVCGVEFPSRLGGKFVISRFDLRTRTFRSQVLAPAKVLGGIKVYGNQLYYVDYDKRFVGVMPKADLSPAQ